MAARVSRAGGPGRSVVRAGERALVRSPVPGRVGVPASGLARRRLRGAGERSQVASIQRSRILAAVVGAVEELGYADVSVSEIVARSHVSRRTFYELFANREQCLTALLGDTLARVQGEFERAGVGCLGWRERLRVGLWVVLSFLEREPVLARACVVQAFGGGEEVRVLRENVLARLAGVVDEGRFESSRGSECVPLTAEGLVGAAYMIVYGRLARPESEPLTGLFGELMGMLVLPYLGPAVARREQARPAPRLLAGSRQEVLAGSTAADDTLQDVNMRLTYRTARVLEGVLEKPGASNRQVADHAGIGDPGQISKLLRRLQRLGLLENRGPGHAQGEPNEWWLTARGERVVQSIRVHSSREAA